MLLKAFLFIYFCIAGDPVYMTLRESEQEFLNYCVGVNCSKTVDTVAKEFGNENTYVRFNESVSGEEVVILVPNEMSANSLMELLIKIRTAKQSLAKTVDIVPFSGKKTIVLKSSVDNILLSQEQLIDLFATAGATFFNSSAIRPKNAHLTLPYSFNLGSSVVVDSGTHPALAKDIARQLSAPLTVFTDLTSIQREQTVLLVTSPASPVNENLFITLQAIAELKKITSHIIIVSPYLPYARSDKVDHSGVTVTGRLVADIFESFGAAAVQFVRAHAPQSQGFFSVPTIQTKSRETINTYLKTQHVEQIISPDAGFQKDATLFAEELSLGLSVVNKQRDLLTGESRIHNMSGFSPRGKIVAIVDDETATGGTLAKVAEFLKRKGAKKVIAVVTHLAGNAIQAIESPYIDSIAVTDTLPITAVSPKLVVLPIAPEIVADLVSFVPSTTLISRPIINLNTNCRSLFTKGNLP